MKSPFFTTAFTLFGQTVSTQSRRFTLLSSALSFCMAILPSLAVGQTVSTWAGGGTGNWLNGAAWSPNGVPSGASADVVIDGPVGAPASVLYGRNDNVGTDITIGRLTLGAGDGVSFGSATTKLTLGDNAAFSGAGSLVIDGTLSLPFSSNSLSGVKSLTGTGMLLLGSTGQRPEIKNDTTNVTTIKGSALFGRSNASNPRMINSGLIEANVSGQDIDFHGQGGANRSENTGTLKASGGGIMSFGQGTWLNSGGTINADGAGSRVAFYRGGLIEGGTISATNGGMLQVGGSFTGGNGGATFKNVTLTGPTNLVQELLINETLTNNGVISIPDGGRLGDASNSVTIAGTGQIVLDAAEDNAPELINQGNSSLPSIPWLFSGVKVRGRGNVGYRQSLGTIDNVAITNQGTFEADVDGQTLLIDVANFDNRSGGVLRATGSGNNALGGILRLGFNGPLKNTGGTIEALYGGRIEAAAARIEGGLIRNGRPDAVPPVPGGSIPLAGMTIVNPSAAHASLPFRDADANGMLLQGDIAVGNTGYNTSSVPRLVGEIKNSGKLRLAATGGNTSYLFLSESAKKFVTFTGGGEVILGTMPDGSLGNDNAFLIESTDGPFATRTLANVDNTIHGFGRIGRDPSYGIYLNIENAALISADVSGRTLGVEFNGGTNNGGTYRAQSGGTLSMRTTNLLNSGGILEALNESPFRFTSASITGGTLRNVGAAAGATNFDLGGATLTDLKLQGAMVERNGATTTLVGAIENEGSIRVRSTGSATLLAVGSASVTAVSLNGPGELILGDPALGSSSSYLTASASSSNPTLTLNQNLRGFGFVGVRVDSTRVMHLVNNAEIRADVSGKQLRVAPISLLNSPGKTLSATNGGTLYLHPVQLTNTNATISAGANSTVQFNTEAIVHGGVVNSDVSGTIEVLNNLAARNGVVFTNAGTLLLGTGNNNSTFEGLANGGSSLISSGTIRKSGGGDYSLRTALNNTGAVDVQGGVLRFFGGGTISGSAHTVEQNAHLTFQGTPGYTFTGTSSLSGGGTNWFASGVTITLPAAADVVDAANLNFENATLTGPGLLTHSGRLAFTYASNNTISEARISTLPGATASLEVAYYAPLQFTNGASWDNRGTILFNNAGWRPIVVGAAGSTLTNHPGGVIRQEDSERGDLDMALDNQGQIQVVRGSLNLYKSSSWTGGTASIATGAAIWVNNATLTANGLANTSTGAGWMQVNGSGSLALPSGSRLTADRIGFWDTSSISGPGELRVQFSADWNLPSNVTHVINGTQVNLLPGSVNYFRETNRILRLQNGALMRNAGTMSFIKATQLKLESNSVYENAGITEFNPSGTGNLAYAGSDDGTGLFRTLEDSITRFIPNNAFRMSFGVPVEFAGQVYANDGYQVTFAQGGLLKSTAKLWPNHPSSSITFAGAAPLRVQGRNNEFSGTGIVRFSNTRLSFEDPSADPADDPLIAAGATVGFVDATNVVEGNGLLSGTQFTFAGASTTINQTTLQNSEGWSSNWIATGGTLTLQNGARFLNEGIFTISTRIGSWTGSAGTLFHNKSTGRLVHDTSTTTVIDVPFQNDGKLETRAGTLNFSKEVQGNGGIAASNGAKVDVPMQNAPLNQLPKSLESTGPSTELNAALPPGDKTIELVADAGRLVAAGGGNLVAPPTGAGILSQNGGVLVAAGGMNLVAAGGGNITAAGANSRINGSGSLVAAGGGNVLSLNGGGIVAAGGLNADGGTATANAGRIETPANLVAAGGGNLVSLNGGGIVAAGGLNANGPGNVIATGAGSLMQASGIVAAGGMNLVAAGGGNIVAAGGLNGSAGEAPQARMASFGEEPSSGPGTITVDTGSRLAGDGTFEGQGEVMNGSSVNPGFEALGGSNQVGAMQWNGSLEIAAGASLNLQLGGTTAGTQYDLLNVSQAFVMNGTLLVTFVNGFGASINSTHTFDVAVATSGITSGLSGTRIPVANAYGTFLVTLVNGGTTLRLSDYQLSDPIFSQWATIQGLSGADADPLADPFHTGTSNLMKYALGLSPQSNGSPISTGTWEDLSGQQFLTISYTRPQGSAAPSDITYEPQRSTSLAPGSWLGGPTQMEPVGSPVPGPGDLETITVRSMHPIGPASPSEFLRLRVEQVPLTP